MKALNRNEVTFEQSRPHQTYPCKIYNAKGDLVSTVSAEEQIKGVWDHQKYIEATSLKMRRQIRYTNAQRATK